MKKFKKLAALLLSVVCISISLSACGNAEESIMLTLVKGNIAEIYLGKFDATYLKLVESTEEESTQAYLENMLYQAEYFAMYWGIFETEYDESFDDLDENLQNEIIELMKEIYGKSKYEVQSAVKQDDNTYAVKVVIEPIDIMEKASEIYLSETYEPLNAFWDKYAEVDFTTISDEDYLSYMNEYGEIILQLVKEQLPNLGYGDSKSQSLQVETVDELWQINDDDWNILDSYLVTYP